MSEMTDFVSTHKPLVIGGMVIGVLLIGGYLLNKKTATSAGSSPNGLSDTSGLTNGKLVYVPTQTSFITDNQNGVFASGDPNLKSIDVSGGLYSNSPQVTNSTVTTPTPVIVVPPVVPPVVIPPTPKPKNHDGDGHRKRVDFKIPILLQGPQSFPGPHPGPIPQPISGPPIVRNPPAPQTTTATGGTLQWNQSHVMVGGETVSSLTSKVNRNLKATGMPGAYAVSPHEVYAQNASVIVPQARTSPGDHLTAAHAGTRILLPSWSR